MRRGLHWVGSSLKDLREFPKNVQQDIGFALLRVQDGDTPPQQKKLKGGDMAGVYEIRQDDRGSTYRAVYATTIGEVIYVLHAFQKKSKRGGETPPADMRLVRARLQSARQYAREQQS